MRYIRRYNHNARPIRWTYQIPLTGSGPLSIDRLRAT